LTLSFFNVEFADIVRNLMHDDLHKSVPPRTAWARVLRLACAHASASELREATVNAVRRDADWLATPWGHQLNSVLELGRNDLFAQERVRAELKKLQATSPNPHARSVCEIALGVLARDGSVSTNFRTVVMTQAMRAFAQDCVELVSSKVADRFGAGQAGQVRRLLHGLLPACDFLSAPARAPTAPNTVESVLSQPLALNL
jgi:hypothetical protein